MDPLVSSFIGLLMPLGWASFKMLDAAVSDDDNGGTTGGEDDRDRDASDRAAVLCNAAAGKGRLAASRASLSLLLAFPVEANLRCCFAPEPTLAVRGGGDTKAVPKFPFTPTLPNDDEGSGSGAALAAATDKDSRLEATSD